MLLSSVRALTLYPGRLTTGRRSAPVPQLRCQHGDACDKHVPEVIRCRNDGTDGRDAQWTCVAALDSRYRLGRVEVSCEGYDYPDDPYVLVGSCGLEYALHLTEEGRAYYYGRDGKGTSRGSQRDSRADTDEGEASPLALFLFFALFVLLITCCRQRRDPRGTYAPPGPDPDDRRGHGGARRPGDPHDDPPPYNRKHSTCHVLLILTIW